eukprot:m.23595 g.23595  ORF g.23595 m.23595 type:complete len:1140 (+) comp7521_c0_seq1:89-3508(+)
MPRVYISKMFSNGLLKMISLALAMVVMKTYAQEQMAGPASRGDFESWFAGMQQWREKTRQSVNYTGYVYNVPELRWTQTAYIQPQMHPYDRYFYNETLRNYTVDTFLDDLVTRYGGIDAMLLWPTYTNIGIDDRNQFDLIRAMPGGPAELKRLAGLLHARGVKVLVPYNPWDQDLRPLSVNNSVEMANLLKETDCDGFNGDTMHKVPQEFYDAAMNVQHPIAIEPEGGGDQTTANFDSMGWGYWQYPMIPSIDSWKWLDSRRLTNVCERWSTDHTNAVQYAVFNGVGFESWENVWGFWNGVTPRDGERIRRAGTLMRFCGGKGHTMSQGWVPHTPETLANSSVFASKWPLNDSVLWTLVNRGTENTTGPQLVINTSSVTFVKSAHFYDLYHGVELNPEYNQDKTQLTLSFDIEQGSFGYILATSNTTSTDPALANLLSTMASMTKRSLSSYNATWTWIPQQRIPVMRTTPMKTAPSGMVYIKGGAFHFKVSGIEIEGGNKQGEDVQFPWESFPQRNHDQMLSIQNFYIDQYPVTNQQYADFLARTHWQPHDSRFWLKHWIHLENGTMFPASNITNAPVTYVSLADARAYCALNGKRLPHEEEWQYAAQGTDGRLYPWGNSNDQSKYPTFCSPCHGASPTPENVTAYSPQGHSPFNVGDLVGNVWQYTSEFQDAHTRGVIVRGSSNYRPKVYYGTNWYFPAQMELNTHNRYFLMDDSYERAGTLGFRCVADAEQCSDPLCLSLRAPDYTPNLTTLGSMGWAQWGDGGISAMARNHPLTGATISNITVIGSAPLQNYSNNNVAFSWSDGDPSHGPVVSNGTTTGVYQNVNNGVAGFSMTISNIPLLENDTLMEASFFVGLYGRIAGNFSSSLSDGSGPYSDASVSSTTHRTTNGAYRVLFKPKAGVSLSVRWVAQSIAAPCSQAVCGFANTSPDAVIDLSAEGSVTWIHWGYNKIASDQKQGAADMIKYTAIGQGNMNSYNNNPTTFSWNDGTPTKKATASPTGIALENGKAVAAGSGFNITVDLPAGKDTPGAYRIVRLYAGVFSSSASLSVTSSIKGDIPVYKDASLSSTGIGNVMYTLFFAGRSEQTVTLTWTLTKTSGNIQLQAVSVDDFDPSSEDESNLTWQAVTLAPHAFTRVYP